MNKQKGGEVLNVYKPVGATPLEVLDWLKEKRPEYKDQKMSYAGKLDPMAEGVLVILVGDEIENQADYQSMDKEYIADILFGFSTDSYDLLGLVNENSKDVSLRKSDLSEEIAGWQGERRVELPPFSAYEISGKPLFKWAREGSLDEIDIPEKDMEVYKASLINFSDKSTEEILSDVESRVGKVGGDFRQDEIIDKWRSFLAGDQTHYPVAQVKFQCASGTYIRSIANQIGSDLGAPSVLYSLSRTKVGSLQAPNQSFWAGDSLRISS